MIHIEFESSTSGLYGFKGDALCIVSQIFPNLCTHPHSPTQPLRVAYTDLEQFVMRQTYWCWHHRREPWHTYWDYLEKMEEAMPVERRLGVRYKAAPLLCLTKVPWYTFFLMDGTHWIRKYHCWSLVQTNTQTYFFTWTCCFHFCCLIWFSLFAGDEVYFI